MSLMEKLSKYKGKIAAVSVAVGMLVGGTQLINKAIDKFSENYLTQEDFETVEWIEFNNLNGRIYSCYMKENIPKNQANYHLYLSEVRRGNNNNLVGNILLPDLDGDGKVGK